METEIETSEGGGPAASGPRPIHQGAVIACAFLGGPEAVATGSMEGAIVIWDVATGAPLKRIAAHAGPIPALAWDPVRRRLISGGLVYFLVF